MTPIAIDYSILFGSPHIRDLLFSNHRGTKRLKMTDDSPKSLWFTSTMSSELTGHVAFAGLYECQLEEDGTCVEPKLIVDRWDTNGTHHRGLDLMDVSCLVS